MAVCTFCKGAGEVGTEVQWSDGLGLSSRECPVCGGVGNIDFDPVAKLAEVNTLLQSFLYKTWLVAGCNVQHHNQSRLQPHEQGLRNEVLRLLESFPEHTHRSCEVKNTYEEGYRQEKARLRR